MWEQLKVIKQHDLGFGDSVVPGFSSGSASDQLWDTGHGACHSTYLNLVCEWGYWDHPNKLALRWSCIRSDTKAPGQCLNMRYCYWFYPHRKNNNSAVVSILNCQKDSSVAVRCPVIQGFCDQKSLGISELRYLCLRRSPVLVNPFSSL